MCVETLANVILQDRCYGVESKQEVANNVEMCRRRERADTHSKGRTR